MELDLCISGGARISEWPECQQAPGGHLERKPWQKSCRSQQYPARTEALPRHRRWIERHGGFLSISSLGDAGSTDATRRVAGLHGCASVDAMVMLGTTLVGPMLQHALASAVWVASSRSVCSTFRRRSSTPITDSGRPVRPRQSAVLMGYLPCRGVLTAKAMYGTI